MGKSTNGILAYGYNLGGDEGGWQIIEAGEYGDWEPPWFPDDDEDNDFMSAAMRVLRASAGFTETDWRADGFYEREREADARLGVELESYCSGDYPRWLLAAHVITVYRGSVKEIDFADLERQRTEGDWDGKLAAAIQALGITPKQDRPKWLLVSYWG